MVRNHIMTLKYIIQNPKPIIFCLEESLSIMIMQVPTLVSFLHYILTQPIPMPKVKENLWVIHIPHKKYIMCFLFLSKVNPICPPGLPCTCMGQRRGLHGKPRQGVQWPGFGWRSHADACQQTVAARGCKWGWGLGNLDSRCVGNKFGFLMSDIQQRW